MSNRRSRAVTALTALLVVGAAAGTAHGPETQGTERRRTAEPAVSQNAVLGPVLGDQTRPNIVVIMADDMREDELAHMPRTRALVEDQGLRFVNSFSQHPQCCPARASFLTGRYTHNHGVWSNRGDYGGFLRLDDADTMPVRLNRAGYNTVFLGKYLNDYGTLPLTNGSPSTTYVPPGWADWRGAASGIYNYFNTTLNVDGTLRANPGWYQTRMFGAETRDIISRHARSPRPFFLWASYVAPHVGAPREKDDPDPVEREDGHLYQFLSPAVPADVRDMFDSEILRAPGDGGEEDVGDKPYYIRDQPPANLVERAALTEVTRQRAESLEVLDQEVEQTIEALERAGELDDTVVVFTSDNGYFLGEHRIRQGKLLPYEPALRVPLLVRGPGIPAGEVSQTPVLTIDFAPTLLGLAATRPDPAMDGADFLAATLGRASDLGVGWTRAVLTETGPRSTARNTPDGTLPPGADTLRFTQGVRTGRYLYVEHATGERELYDQRTDPAQLENLVGRERAEAAVRQLAALLDRLEDCTGPECREPAPASLHR